MSCARTPLRIAIVSTPRSGNTWLWHLLTAVYDMPGIAAHTPLEVEWDRLPERVVLQMHWKRHPAFEAKLLKYGFRVVVMVRHPLDVLISILHFSLHDRATARWLDGEEGNERPIFGAMPRSCAFREYVLGKRAAALLSVTPQWWKAPGPRPARPAAREPQGNGGSAGWHGAVASGVTGRPGHEPFAVTLAGYRRAVGQNSGLARKRGV